MQFEIGSVLNYTYLDTWIGSTLGSGAFFNASIIHRSVLSGVTF